MSGTIIAIGAGIAVLGSFGAGICGKSKFSERRVVLV